ncbi:unnamed protein product [Pleuronectes platessa]|uniref:Uncharacterized protein n=1 Tax=Pleuronectes platessa TaxID=8262 RepID=A0A9N7U653_PLEPL|nr:unnamed protein product [Pleuronectes platessa]
MKEKLVLVLWKLSAVNWHLNMQRKTISLSLPIGQSNNVPVTYARNPDRQTDRQAERQRDRQTDRIRACSRDQSWEEMRKQQVLAEFYLSIGGPGSPSGP